ncbi:LysR family transcriptional regulator [Sphingomonas koreensis]|nr:LysR family transcriptional regulator [Sphingomonas koreensis]
MTHLLGMTIFVRTVETGSFSAAASQLGLSPQMAGRHVKQIEGRFGTRLLNRSTRNQSLTEVGRLYYDQCKRALAQVEAADAILASHGDEPRGKLRIAAPASFASCHLAQLLPRFLEEFGDVRIDLVVTDKLDVVDGGFDLVFWVGTLPNSTLNVRTLAPFHRILCAAPDYLERNGAPERPDDLRLHDCLDGSVSPQVTPTSWHFERGGETIDVPVAGALRINDERSLVDAAVAGAGVLLGCRSLLMAHVRQGRLIRLLSQYEVPSLPINVLFAAKSDMPKTVRRFLDWIVIQAEERSHRNRLSDSAWDDEAPERTVDSQLANRPS